MRVKSLVVISKDANAGRAPPRCLRCHTMDELRDAKTQIGRASFFIVGGR